MDYRAPALAADTTDVGFANYWDWPVISTSHNKKKTAGAGSQPRYNVLDFIEQAQIKQRFKALAQRWDDETLDLSSLTEILSHKDYLAIIALGRPALPFLFAELARQPNYWFTAISAILRANNEHTEVVDESDYGDLQKMTDAWLVWGKQEGYLD